MKELSIEEKAKRYDESRERMKDFLKEWENCGALGKAMEKAKAVFPELKESDDERIRKAIIEHFANSHSCMYPYKGFTKQQILAWLEKQKFTQKDVDDAWLKGMCDAKHELEKQGEQKSADKVEQKGMNIVEEDMTPFQKKVFCIIDTTIEEEHGLKQVCDELLRLAHDEIMQKPAWSKEDEDYYDAIIAKLEVTQEDAALTNNQMEFLKSLKDRYTWKPSDVQMKQLGWVAEQNKDNMIGKELVSLYQDLKNLREE